jgi:hypothetical protein
MEPLNTFCELRYVCKINISQVNDISKSEINTNPNPETQSARVGVCYSMKRNEKGNEERMRGTRVVKCCC